MKKLIFLLLIFFSLVVVVGCNARRNNEAQTAPPTPTVTETAGETKTTIIAIDDKEKTDKPAVPIAIAPKNNEAKKTALAATGSSAEWLFVLSFALSLLMFRFKRA